VKKIIISAVIALFAAFGAQAQTVHYNGTDDTVPAFKVYNGYTGTLSMVVSGSGTQILVTVDGLENTVDGSGNTDTIAEIQAAIVAVTNTSGTASLVVDSSYSLSTDSTDGELLDGTYTAVAGAWASVPYDTSAAKFYQVAIPSRDPKFDRSGDEILAGRIPAVSFNVKRAYGNPTGTGNATLKVYVDGTEKYSQVYPEGYVLGLGGTNALNSVIEVSEELDLPVGAQDSVIVRILRASTAAGGNAGFIAE